MLGYWMHNMVSIYIKLSVSMYYGALYTIVSVMKMIIIFITETIVYSESLQREMYWFIITFPIPFWVYC